jgi:hypothetical protein
MGMGTKIKNILYAEIVKNQVPSLPGQQNFGEKNTSYKLTLCTEYQVRTTI